MIPVIFLAPKQAAQTRLLVQHCLELDGTVVRVIEAKEPEMGYPDICNWAFLEICRQMKGKDFLWLEADAIPTTKGWLKAITADWKKAKADGKSVLWSTDSTPPFDRCCGVGVYSSDILEHLPETIPSTGGGFDGWILDNLEDRIARTPLIQHSYGIYNLEGTDAQLWRHPTPRADAVLFHKDQYQDLIWDGKPQRPMHFGSSGDLGDILLMLPLIQQLGGKHCLWLYDRPWTKRIEPRFHLIEPLLSAQPYIEYVAVGNGKAIEYDLSTFRERYVPTRTLLASHADWAALKYGLPAATGDKPWLTVEPSPVSRGRVVIARSPRYHNPHFSWSQILAHYGDKLLFVGIPEEHADFIQAFGAVEFAPTSNMLEVAQLIAGSELFIGNQSSPNAIAEGLKHPRIQETNLRVPDCVFPGSENAQYVADGAVVLPAVGDLEEWIIASALGGFREPNPQECPPNMWQYPGALSQYNLVAIANEVAGKEGISFNEAQQKVFDVNTERCPDFFRRSDRNSILVNVIRARENAGLSI